ncbi:hypothetical protein NN561_001934 [Cricetulus griseus]
MRRAVPANPRGEARGPGRKWWRPRDREVPRREGHAPAQKGAEGAGREGAGGGAPPGGGGGPANPRAAWLPGRPISPRLAHNASRGGRFSITLGCVGRWPGIKGSARAGGRHSGVRLEVSLGAPSLWTVTCGRPRAGGPGSGQGGQGWVPPGATMGPPRPCARTARGGAGELCVCF